MHVRAAVIGGRDLVEVTSYCPETDAQVRVSLDFRRPLGGRGALRVLCRVVLATILAVNDRPSK